VRARTIKGSPERSASAAWAEVERMIAETLHPASDIDDDDVRAALAVLTPIGPMLAAGGVLTGDPIVLRALPLQLEISVAMGNPALSGEERLGKVPGAVTATEWAIYIPDPEPWRAQVCAEAAKHRALHAGPAPAESQAAAALSAGAAIDPEALRRISGVTR
jgi:hypothetical protein